ncbi:hypothetical protein [Thiomicrorhabdus aquaedulcis]|uniref:hypothetical protein n=1 Tax=Thiomicrorhabdus aquaedulcis TaxID=2211106 RepID=UPI000FD72B0C|nr:hypothetical protein [Thiomicrorhabdus aquaedulcis]
MKNQEFLEGVVALEQLVKDLAYKHKVPEELVLSVLMNKITGDSAGLKECIKKGQASVRSGRAPSWIKLAVGVLARNNLQ